MFGGIPATMESPMNLLPGVRSQTIETDRLRLRYLESGTSDGIPVVMIHGNLATGRFRTGFCARNGLSAAAIGDSMETVSTVSGSLAVNLQSWRHRFSTR